MSSYTSYASTNTRGVERCYDILHLAERIGGISDFTDGMYYGEYRPGKTRYLEAQANQARYLLNQAGCEHGSSLLDVGCGYGRILATARLRGAHATGITISRPQHERCKARGLNTFLMNYRDMPQSWSSMFTAIIANGSGEHFVQPLDAAQGLQDQIYSDMFETMHRLLQPGGAFVTTMIHFRNPQGYSPVSVMAHDNPKGSAEYQFKSIFTSLPGWYPVEDQLERCAAPYFKLLLTNDGTEDYHHTSEFWLRQIKIRFSTDPRAMAIFLRAWIRRDWVWKMIRCWAFDQSWAWQFRYGPGGSPPPTILYRHTWKRIG